jgi:tetratricopeptide (TPR) repeat protein
MIVLWHHGSWGHFSKKLLDLIEKGDLGVLPGNRYLAEGALVCIKGPEAEDHARKALEARPGDRVALGLLGEALLLQGKLDEAAAAAGEGLGRHPTDGRLLFVRGEVARQRGHFREAAPDLERAAKTSVYSDRWERYARCLSELDDASSWEKGVVAARRALSYDPFACYTYRSNTRPIPGDPRLHRTLGDLRRKQGLLAAAALHYQRAFLMPKYQPRIAQATGPDQTDALLCGEVHEQLGLLGEAVWYYEQALADPKIKAQAEARLARFKRR